MSPPVHAPVLVVGEALADIVQEPSGHQRVHPGGSPANVALGLARLSHPVHLATRIGQDQIGDLLCNHLRSSGVELIAGSFIDGPTSTATAELDTDGNATYRFDIAWDVPSKALQLAGDLDCAPPLHVHTGSIAAALQPGADKVTALLATARSHCTISYDPNLRPAILRSADEERPGVERLVALSDVVKASEEDLAWLYPGQHPERVAARWAQTGTALIVLTRGSQGAEAFWGSSRHAMPPLQRPVTDTIGAGDAYMAGLLSGLLTAGLLGSALSPQTPTPRQKLHAALQGTVPHDGVAEALDWAGHVAALTCSRHGADPPTLAEVLAHYHL